jgi:uncharacterized protein (TIGR02145 family)
MKQKLILSTLLVHLCIFSIIGCKKDKDEKLAVLLTVKVTEITHHSATSGGIINDEGGSAITERGVCWNTDQNPTINDYKTSDGTGVAGFTSKMTGLEPETTYYVRAYATNVFGVSYGSQVSFATTVNVIFGQPCPGMSVITDVDGNVYNTVIIGAQCWMKENLKTTHYRDETPIDNYGLNNSAWHNNTTGAYAWYDNDISFKDSYGALYNWYAVINTSKLCPTGWRIPRLEEWKQLVSYVELQGNPNQNDNPNGASNALKSCRQANSPFGDDCNTYEHPLWGSDNIHHGFDRFGFSALPGGMRNDSGDFSGIVYSGGWHSSTASSDSRASVTYLHQSTGKVVYGNPTKASGESVRCIKE